MCGSIHLALLVAACIIGQATGQASADDTESSGQPPPCSVYGCEICSATDSTVCEKCYDGAGFYLEAGQCQPCTDSTTCSACSSATVCTQCAASGTGPDFAAADGSCGPCGADCTICDNSGAGQCDPTGCNPRFAYDTTTQTCQPCLGADCPGCVVPHTCPTCVDGEGLDESGNLPPDGCKKCTVPHCAQCTGDYHQCDNCKAQYNTNYTTDKCDPICATIPQSEWRGNPAATCSSTLIHPVSWIIIHHTLTDRCFTQKACQVILQSLQRNNMAPKSLSNLGGGQTDLLYHYLIGDDGQIYEGRKKTCCGFTYADRKSLKYNCHSYDIAFIGNFKQVSPTEAAWAALDRFVSTAATNRFFINCAGPLYFDLATTWQMLSHRDVGCTLCPGGNLTRGLTQKYGPSGRYTPNPFCTSGQTDTHPVK